MRRIGFRSIGGPSWTTPDGLSTGPCGKYLLPKKNAIPITAIHFRDIEIDLPDTAATAERPVKEDERQLWEAMRAKGAFNELSTETARETAARLGIHRKRARYLLGKWAARGWYKWGVCIDMGWLTPEGMAAKR